VPLERILELLVPRQSVELSLSRGSAKCRIPSYASDDVTALLGIWFFTFYSVTYCGPRLSALAEMRVRWILSCVLRYSKQLHWKTSTHILGVSAPLTVWPIAVRYHRSFLDPPVSWKILGSFITLPLAMVPRRASGTADMPMTMLKTEPYPISFLLIRCVCPYRSNLYTSYLLIVLLSYIQPVKA
jgi:hypothetical protein